MNPEIKIPSNWPKVKDKSTIELSENFFYLNNSTKKIDNQLLTSKFKDGEIYENNKLFFKYFETETKKVFFLSI
jgi:hypothetical protein